MRTIAKYLPLPVTIFIMRTLFKLPLNAQRTIFKHNTRPRPNQKQWIHNVESDHGLRAAWIGEGVKSSDDSTVEEEARDADVVLLFVHGGAARFGHSKMYMDSFIRWINDIHSDQGLKMRILTVKYGLTPEMRYPLQIQSVAAAYKYLIETVKIDPLKIIFAGDSMGGHFCVSTLYHNQLYPEVLNYTSPLPIPGGVILISPFLLHGVANVGSYHKNKRRDYVPLRLGLHIIEEHTPADLDFPLQDPRISPYFASDFKSWLPSHVLVIVGTKEVMLDDILAFTNKIIAEGVIDVTIIEEPMTHDWFCVNEVVRDKVALSNAEKIMGTVIRRTVDAAADDRVQEKVENVDEIEEIPVKTEEGVEGKIDEKVVVDNVEKDVVRIETAILEAVQAS